MRFWGYDGALEVSFLVTEPPCAISSLLLRPMRPAA